MAPEVVRSIWNDEPGDAELVIVSTRFAGAAHEDTDYVPDFWPQ